MPVGLLFSNLEIFTLIVHHMGVPFSLTHNIHHVRAVRNFSVKEIAVREDLVNEKVVC